MTIVSCTDRVHTGRYHIYGEGQEAAFLECPWVQITNLYVSLTTTGDISWKSLADQLFGRGHLKLAVFSGRHGDMYGTLVTAHGLIRGPHIDEAHVMEDRAMQVRVRATHPTIIPSQIF